ncbi:MAG: hypothetical protein JWO89_496 [Verrucomicrobiaceae bacterium]|nr:hypothetical protein [Verrucomicrobiaceae bacterium]MDB6116738.1 hypothetical protein [Verrucomicrobiaceae bacterium]
MKPSEETFVLPGVTTLESWRAGGKGSATRLDDSKTKNAGWFALPMRSVISVPMHFPAMAPDKREAAALLELEGLGLANLDPSDFQVQVRDEELREQRAWTVVQTPVIPPAMLQGGMDGQYAPSVSFHTLKHGEARLWQESGRLVMAVPDEKNEPVHAQALSAYEADEDAAAEMRCILAALDLGGISPVVNEVVIEQAAESAAHPEALTPFADALGLPVATEPPTPPHLPAERWRMLPQTIVHRRMQRKQQQTMMLAGAGFVLVLVALLGTFALRLVSRERGLAAETARLNALEPELQSIRDAQTQWATLESAVTPDQYAVEVFHQVANLLPEKGVRLTTFDIKEGHIIIGGEASNQALAGALREDLKRVPAFAGLQWDFPTPIMSATGQATFRAEGSPNSPDLATNP